MRTNDSPDDITQLPSAPAPPARDANPWTMPAEAIPRQAPRHRRPRRRDEPRPGRSWLAALLPIAFVAAMLAVEWFKGRDAPRARDLAELAGPAMVLVVFIVLALVKLRARRRARRGRDSLTSQE